MLRRSTTVLRSIKKTKKPLIQNLKNVLPHEQAEAEEKELSWWQEQLNSGDTWEEPKPELSDSCINT